MRQTELDRPDAALSHEGVTKAKSAIAQLNITSTSRDERYAVHGVIAIALELGVNRRFVSPSTAYGYKPYAATVTEIDTRFKRDGYARRRHRQKISCTNTFSSAEIEDEQRDRLHLERKVERAFFEAGKALMELRDRRLYRSTHRTFEEYCSARFGHSRRQSYLLMDAAVVFDIGLWSKNSFLLQSPTTEIVDK